MLIDSANVDLVRLALMIIAAAIAVATDTRERRIPNSLTLTLAAAGLVIGLASEGLSGLVMAAAGFVTGVMLFLIPIAKLGWGMGDLKLVAALGAVAGPLFVLWMGLYAMVAGGIFALLWLRQGGQLAQVASGMRGDLQAGQAPRARSGLSIPFAVPIAAGMLVALLVSPGLPH
jgi:prepilin peptidase CpaA